jgi:hypothetical protein
VLLRASGYLARVPTVLRIAGLRLLFYSADRMEPRHIHVECAEGTAKFWLDPVRLKSSAGLSPRRLARILRLVEIHREHLLRSWDDFFSA